MLQLSILAENGKRVRGRMLGKFFKRYGWMYIPGVLFLVINSRVATLAPKALGEAIGLVEAGAVTQEVMRSAVIIVAIALGVFATRFVWRMMIILNARRMECFLREELFVKLQSLPPDFYAKRRSGDLLAYAINDVGSVRQTFGPALAQAINGILTGALSIYSMIGETSLSMSLLALAPVPIAVAVILIAGKVVRRRSRRVQELFAGVSGFVNESIMGIRVVKAFAREDEWQAEFDRTSDELQTANVKLADASALIQPITALTFGLSYAISLIIGGKMVIDGTLGLSNLVSFLGYLLLIQHPVVSLGRIVNMVQRGLASYKRLRDIFDEEEIPAFEQSDYSAPIDGEIEAKNLTFTYPGMNAPALRGVSFKLRAGGTLGIAGETGSGKTTLAALLMKFYHCERGELFIDGVDICDIPARAIREASGYVPQDGFLFSATIEDNILFYTPNKSEEDARKAAELAGVLGDIERLPDGFNTEVGERGTHLSGGQRQRIGLARALVRSPQVILLDDTLSAVDNITERRIVENLHGELADRTAVIISHRLSALEDADLILYLRDGEVVESGTHDELVTLGGAYAAAWSKQKEGGDNE